MLLKRHECRRSTEAAAETAQRCRRRSGQPSLLSEARLMVGSTLRGSVALRRMMRLIRGGETTCAFTGLDAGRGLRRRDAVRGGQQ